MRYENSVTIERPVEDVFTYMTTVENSPTWQSPVLEARQTSSGPLGVGATFVVTAKVLGRQFQSTAEITAWNPPHSWTVKTTSGPLHGTGQFTLTPQGGSTRVDAVSDLEPTGFFKLAGPAFEQLAKRQAQQDLETLKAALESRADPTSATS
jgi:carbon monoxide dehydrogenase subunit G